MRKTSKTLALFLTLIMAVSCLTEVIIKPANAQNPYFPAPTPETQNFTYMLSDYVVNYSIVKEPPPDRISTHPYGYNLIVYANYPPFPIQISFYDGTQKISEIIPTNVYSSTFGTYSYPTQIAMSQVSNESISPTPISTTMSTHSPSPPVPELSWLVILPLLLSVFSVAGVLRQRKTLH